MRELRRMAEVLDSIAAMLETEWDCETWTEEVEWPSVNVVTDLHEKPWTRVDPTDVHALVREMERKVLAELRRVEAGA